MDRTALPYRAWLAIVKLWRIFTLNYTDHWTRHFSLTTKCLGRCTCARNYFRHQRIRYRIHWLFISSSVKWFTTLTTRRAFELAVKIGDVCSSYLIITVSILRTLPMVITKSHSSATLSKRPSNGRSILPVSTQFRYRILSFNCPFIFQTKRSI